MHAKRQLNNVVVVKVFLYRHTLEQEQYLLHSLHSLFIDNQRYSTDGCMYDS